MESQNGQLVLELGSGTPVELPRARSFRDRHGVRLWNRALARAEGAFMHDRNASCWDAGQPWRDGDTVSRRVARFVPSSVPPETWERIAPFVRRATEMAASTPYSAATLASVTAQLLHWCDREGFPLHDDVVLHPDTVDRFVAEGCRHLRPGTRLNYQSQLRRVGELLVGAPLYPTRRLPTGASDPLAPYTDEEVAALLGWARGLTTARMRNNTLSLLAFGLGAGLTSRELNALVGTEVAVDADGVLVHVVTGPRQRVVPVLRRWEDHTRQAAERSGTYPVFLPGRDRIRRKDVSRFVEGCPRSDAPKLSVQRLRVTWIVHHLRAGTALAALEAAAGATAAQLAVYAAYVAEPDSVEAGACFGRRRPGDPAVHHRR